MSKIRVIARVVAQAGREAEVHGLLQAMLTPTHAEPGCEFYELFQSDEPSRFYFYELWESKSALDRHMETPHFQNLAAVLPAVIAEPIEINLVQAVSA